MKKVLIVLLLVVSANSFAQSLEKEDLDVIQSIYGRSKAELVKQYMNLSDEQTTAFKKVYDNYEAERKSLGITKLRLVDDYAVNYATLTDAKADELAKGLLKNNLSYEKLYSKTYNKAKKAIGAINAAKFVQLEFYLQTAISSEIQDSIPFIGEIERSKVN
ncbi:MULTISPECIES: hypothetical protein [unclassified Flavobacterium]|uniref:hypothetical protein n=1 Tax=unclassified Flavobacterium TaxID=196869 RepID=UPI000F0C2458|nr:MULTISPECIES: hypothetical protein [unclassified Flavobacterium]AYN04704.1 hypothetical protein EAG11_11415 [Flavobacterium sp. 140616W15]MCD0474701.1 hypothetical protein [Flavobacterium sp. EDS]